MKGRSARFPGERAITLAMDNRNLGFGPLLVLLLPLVLVAPALHAQSAVDERAIIAVAARLDAALDAKDWESVRALFLDEITVHLAGEPEPAKMAADELVALWQADLHPRKASFHLRGGEIVVFDGADSAVLSSKALVRRRVDGVPGDDTHEERSDHRYELDRTEDGWRIRRFAVVSRFTDGNAAVAAHRLPVDEDADEGASEADGESDPERAAGGAAPDDASDGG